jgi:hypothetical protein
MKPIQFAIAAVPLLVLALDARAQSFVIQGTNLIQIAYADTTLTAPEKAFISADILRTVAPGKDSAEIMVYTNEQNSG